MSVQELRARIAKLDAEINIQRQLLQQLERDRSLAQRQLNGVLDPVARLPLEISSEIFLQSLAPFPMHGARYVPMLLLTVCNAWTDIALSTPALWTAIQIKFPCARGLENILPVWLERASSRPLSISLKVGGEVDEGVLAIFRRRAHQLKSLELHEIWRQGGEDTWDGASLGLLSALETLTMRCDSLWSLSRYSTLALLRLTPNLIEYFVEAPAEVLVDDDIDIVEKVVLTKLRRFMCGEPETCPHNGEALLARLSLPKLEALGICTSGGELLAFLQESSPPLLELILSIEHGYGSVDFVALARFLPDLKRLEMWYPRYAEVETLFTVLASQSLLPHLHTLVVHLHSHFEHYEPFWPALARALAARRTRIQVFRLTVLDPLPASRMPAPDILAAMQELMSGGIQVSIGAREEPWSLFD
ncbi:hypothetical protein C8R45DRAFT_1207509 [Mycena sanguinolenta]|nr:hypothetical protein C8R45DRAFT_1207509 [Mycena sanguinolenta]